MQKTMTTLACTAIIAVFAVCANGNAIAADETQHMFGTPSHPVLAGCSKALKIVAPDGTVTQNITENVGTVDDAWMLPNGNILFADNVSATEIEPKSGKVVFRFVPEAQAGGATFSCQRLENGNTLVGYNSTNQVIEVSPEGEIVFSMDLQYLDKIGSHNNMRLARKCKNGNYLVAHKAKGVAVEYKPDGTIVNEFRDPGHPAIFSAVEMTNGHIICTYLDSVVEFDRDAKPVWRFDKSDLPDVEITYMCGIQVLPNGNLVIGNYAANRGETHANSMLEITRDKKLVWRYQNAEWPSSTMGVQLLEVQPVVR